jgi:hypothetical protein
MIHRRFGGMLEFDRNPPLEGTPEQQHAIRSLVTELGPYGSPFRQTLHKIDVAINRKGRHYVPVSFVDFTSTGLLGFCFPTVLQLHYEIDPGWVGGIFLHELGHLVGWHALERTDTSEGWAEGFRLWAQDGQPTVHPVWERINSWGG